jgi:hypothetical protein
MMSELTREDFVAVVTYFKGTFWHFGLSRIPQPSVRLFTETNIVQLKGYFLHNISINKVTKMLHLTRL